MNELFKKHYFPYPNSKYFLTKHENGISYWVPVLFPKPEELLLLDHTM
jgi:hypothetical protein